MIVRVEGTSAELICSQCGLEFPLPFPVRPEIVAPVTFGEQVLREHHAGPGRKKDIHVSKCSASGSWPSPITYRVFHNGVLVAESAVAVTKAG